MKLNNISSVQILIGSVAVLAAYKIFKAYNFLDNEIGKATDNFAQFWVNLDGKVIPSDFYVGRLWRDQFDNNWVLSSDVYNAYSLTYPSEIKQILTTDRVLKEEYRSEVSQ